MVEMREQFEKLPEIAEKLKYLKWSDALECYVELADRPVGLAAWVNGAWYAFQEQQEKIARLQSALDELKTTCKRHNDPMWRGFANDYDKGFSDCAASLLNEINRITGTDK